MKGLIASSKISYGHARALLSTEKPSELAKKIVARNLSVRQTEKIVSKTKEFPREAYQAVRRDPDIIELEKALAEKLGMGIQITNVGNKGRVVISYGNLEQLDQLLRKLES